MLENGNFDIIQAPKWLKIDDLPETLSVDVPFEVAGNRLVLTRTIPQALQVCTGDGEETGVPEAAGGYYVIKRVV